MVSSRSAPRSDQPSRNVKRKTTTKPEIAQTKVSLTDTLGLQKQIQQINEAKTAALADQALFPIHINTIMSFCTLDIIKNNPSTAIAAFKALGNIYVKYIPNDGLNFSTNKSTIPTATKDVEKQKILQYQSVLTMLLQTLLLNAVNTIKNQTQNELLSVQVVAMTVLRELATEMCRVQYSLLHSLTSFNPLTLLIIGFLGSHERDPEAISIFYTTVLAKYDDLRIATFKLIITILRETASNEILIGKLNTNNTATTLFTQNNNNLFQVSSTTIQTELTPYLKPNIFRSNILSLMENVRFATLSHKRASNQSLTLSNDQLSKQQRAVVSELWMVLFSAINVTTPNTTITTSSDQHKYDDISILTRIFALMESHILPQINQPLLLADFLSASFHQGNLIAVQALNGLFILMTKHKLEYPQFFEQLYAICTLDMLYSTYIVQFFKLLHLVLQGAYLPLYFVLGFAKRLSRLSLFAPCTATVYITALVFNMLRKHPMIAPLFNRKATVVLGVAKNAQMDRQAVIETYNPTYAAVAFNKTSEQASPSPSNTAADDNDAEKPAVANTAETTPSSAVPSIFGLMNAAPAQSIFDAQAKPQKKKKGSKQDQFFSSLQSNSSTTINQPLVLTKQNVQDLVNKTTLLLDELHSTDGTSALKGSASSQSTSSSLSSNDVEQLKDINLRWIDGIDPYDADTNILNQSHAAQSSLIEMSDMQYHYLSLIQSQSKILFSDTAPKHAPDIRHLLELVDYQALIKNNLSYRSKHLIPTAFQKPLSLLGKSERLVHYDEQYDAEARRRGQEADEERNTIESLFTW